MERVVWILIGTVMNLCTSHKCFTMHTAITEQKSILWKSIQTFRAKAVNTGSLNETKEMIRATELSFQYPNAKVQKTLRMNKEIHKHVSGTVLLKTWTQTKGIQTSQLVDHLLDVLVADWRERRWTERFLLTNHKNSSAWAWPTKANTQPAWAERTVRLSHVYTNAPRLGGTQTSGVFQSDSASSAVPLTETPPNRTRGGRSGRRPSCPTAGRLEPMGGRGGRS